MINLINSNIERIRRSKLRYIFPIVIFLTILTIIYNYLKINDVNNIIIVEDLVLKSGVIIGFIYAIMVNFFIGEEYTNGTIRNKMILGYSRSKIYLANLITLISIALICYILYIIIIFCLGIPLFGNIISSFNDVLIKLIDLAFIIIAYISIYTFICQIISNQVITISLCLLIMILQIFSSLLFITKLEDSEYYDTYISKNTKVVYETMINIMPVGQAYEIKNGRTLPEDSFEILWVYSSITSSILTIIGIIIFKRKDRN